MCKGRNFLQVGGIVRLYYVMYTIVCMLLSDAGPGSSMIGTTRGSYAIQLKMLTMHKTCLVHFVCVICASNLAAEKITIDS